MIKPIPPSPASSPEGPCPSRDNPAVARCADAWESNYQAAMAKKKSEYFAECAAGSAFRRALPPLSGHQNICDFIACIGYGMANEVITNLVGSKLLYAARIALSGTPKPSRTGVRDVA